MKRRRCRREAKRTFFIFHVAKQRFIAEGLLHELLRNSLNAPQVRFIEKTPRRSLSFFLAGAQGFRTKFCAQVYFALTVWSAKRSQPSCEGVLIVSSKRKNKTLIKKREHQGAPLQKLRAAKANPARVASCGENPLSPNQKKKKKDTVWRPFPFGWGTGIRTPVMTESESVALPLGDAPIFSTLHIIADNFALVNTYFQLF